MAEQQLPADLAVLDALIEIRRKQKQIESFRTRAEANRENVDLEVYRRVIADYDTRHAALAREALPLKARAAEEYRRLRAVRQGIDARHREARLLRDEIEFRHTVGEIDDAELATQLQGPEAHIAECEAELARSDQQRARFGEAMTDQELAGLDSGPPAAPVSALAPPAPVRWPSPAVPAAWGASEPFIEDDKTILRDVVVEPPAFAPDATYVHPDFRGVSAADQGAPDDYEGTIAGQLTAEPEPEPPAPQLPEARLVGDETESAPFEFTLGPVNNIGRADDNQIRLVRTGVSRHHASVVVEGDGFVLKDLGSQNGTFLNGERVTESPLADGDRIWVGAVELVFKLAAHGD